MLTTLQLLYAVWFCLLEPFMMLSTRILYPFTINREVQYQPFQKKIYTYFNLRKNKNIFNLKKFSKIGDMRISKLKALQNTHISKEQYLEIHMSRVSFECSRYIKKFYVFSYVKMR